MTVKTAPSKLEAELIDALDHALPPGSEIESTSTDRLGTVSVTIRMKDVADWPTRHAVLDAVTAFENSIVDLTIRCSFRSVD